MLGFLFRCERLNIWTEHLYNLSWRCIPTSHETWAIAAVSFKSLISEIATSYTNGRDPCQRPYLPPETKGICRRNLGSSCDTNPNNAIITREINPPYISIHLYAVWFPRNGSPFGAFKTPPKRDIRIANSGSWEKKCPQFTGSCTSFRWFCGCLPAQWLAAFQKQRAHFFHWLSVMFTTWANWSHKAQM